MTKVNKLIMRGFKSFAKKTELLFGDDFNVILGPNGSGKCVDGDTIVQLSNGSNIKIRELVNKRIKEGSQKIDDGYIAYGGNEEILCLDRETLKTVPKKIQAFVKRETPDNLLKIRTRSGRIITATEYHPLFIFDNNKIRSVKAGELKEGIRIAVPRKIKTRIKSKTFYELLDLIEENDKIYVPYTDELKKILVKIKEKNTWKELSQKINIPNIVLKGFIDKQAINFAHLVKLLRYAKLEDDKIIELIPKVKAKTSSIQYKVPWKNSPEFARFIGYLLAEGRLPNQSSSQIWFTNDDEEIVEDYKKLIESIFKIRSSVNEYKPNCWDILAYSEPIRKILTKFGMPIASTEHKDITNLFLSHSTDEELAEILNGLYCGDGYVSNRSIEIVTKSKKLAQSIETILLRLGITFSSSFIIKKATNSGYEGIYKNINIYGVENIKTFHTHIKLKHNIKEERIKNILHKKSNPNIDLIEANSLVRKVTKELGIKIKPNKKQFPKIDAYCYNQCLPTRGGVNQLINELFIPAANQTKTQSQALISLQLLSNSDILWDEITSIEKVKPKEEWVYDLCVEKHHNFIANNFFVHNSNVLDALCFVLGKSSAKALRSEKSANLIYNGGKTKKQGKEAEVSIFFDNTKKEFPTEEDTVKITRIVKPTGQSVYKINDVTRTRQQIIELLNIVKINPDGYNIILQGDIVRFCEMSANDRRVLIEEISGINIYEEKKNKAINELNKVEEKLKEVEIILTEREQRLKELKKERDQAITFKELNEKITQNKATFIYKNMKQKQDAVDKHEERIRKEKEELDKINGEIQKIKYLIAQKKKEIEDINKEIEEKGEKDQVMIHKQVEQLKIELATSNDKIKNLENDIKKLKVRKEELGKSQAEVQAKIDTLFQQKNQLKKGLKSAHDQKEEIERKIADFKKRNKLDNIGDIEKEIDTLDGDAEKKQKEILELRQQQQDLLREKDKTEFMIQSIDEKINKVLELQKENKAQLEELKQKKEEFKKATSQLSKRINDDSNYAAQLGDSRRKLIEANEELAKLKSRSLGIQEKIAGNIALKRILEEKKKIQGIYGTVSELGEVSTKYSLALEVAAGPKLKSIVVESDAVAAKCIKFLKDNKLGIVTFLPLNKIKSKSIDPKVKALAKSTGVHGMATDLIEYEPKFKNVFEYVFANTLVVENITTARRIGIGSAKMVTLDGDITEISGAMQGGFRQREKGMGFVEKEVSKALKQYEKIADEMEIKISSLQKQKEVNEQEIVKLREFKANLEGDIIKLEKTLHLDSGDTEANNKLRKELEAQSDKIEKDINKVQMLISDCNKDLAKNKIAKQDLRNKINELRNPILIAELNAFEEKRKELSEIIIKKESDLDNVKAQVKNILEPEIGNLNRVKRELKKEEDETNEQIKETKKHISNIKAELTVKEKEQKKFQEQFKGLFGQRQKLSDDINKQESKLGKYNEKAKQSEHKINAISLESAKNKAELEALRQEFEPYKDVDLVMNKSVDQLKQEIYNAERRIERMGSINMRALEIYDQIEKEYHNLVEKKEKLRLEKDDVMAMMDEIENKKIHQFMNAFDAVNEHFKNIFLALSTKGEASLVLEDKEQPFEGGVLIKVRITGNKFMDIRSLSGGEKTMTALAFIFSIQEHDPASFYIMDEVDAALDKKNSERLAQLIRKYCSRAQYVVISHNDNIISEADILYGVSMDEHGVSKVISLKI